jgi:dihydrofolate reductase
MKITVIAAVDNNWGLGKDNKLAWRLPRDFQWFKEQTMGKMVVMGRKTFESIGSKPLPNRRNWVVTRDSKNVVPAVGTEYGVGIITKPDELLLIAERWGEKEIVIIGGAEVYEMYAEHAERILITHVDTEIDNVDAVFPQLDLNAYNKRELLHVQADHDHAYPFTIVEYTKSICAL